MNNPLAYLDFERLEWEVLKEYIQECPDSLNGQKSVMNQVVAFCDEKIIIISNIIKKQTEIED